MDFGVLFFYSRFGRVNAEKTPLETNGGKNGEDGKKRRIYFGIARHIPYIEEWEGRMIGYREPYMQSAYLHIIRGTPVSSIYILMLHWAMAWKK